ncbi:uncharacterized protein [Typha angustifolia]
MKELSMKNKSPKAMPLSSSSDSEVEEEEMAVVVEAPPPTWNADVNGNRKKLSKHLSMKETTREAKWEKRRRQILQRRRQRVVKKEGEDNDVEVEEKANIGGIRRVRSLTDEDLDELRGSIELGFGFIEEDGGQDLRDTLPALDLYFAVTRQMSDPKIWSSASSASTPTATSSSYTLGGTPSPRSPNEQPPQSQSSPGDLWKIITAGDNPQHVKTRLRHWAQVVACSVRQCC